MKRNADGKFRKLTPKEKEISIIKRKEWRKEYKKQNRDKIREQERERRRLNPEKYNIRKQNYRKRNPEKDKEYSKKHPEIARRKSARERELLTDNYIAGRLTCKTNMSCSEIRNYPELIEAKRLIIKTKRLCKTLKN